MGNMKNGKGILMKFLDKTLNEHVNFIINLETYEDDIGKVYENYNNAILDVFDHQLSVNEANSLEIGSFINYNLKYENRYIATFEDLHIHNKSKTTIVEIDISNLDNLKILNILEGLDYKDKLLFVDLIRLNKSDSNIISIEDIEHLHLFIKLATRELLFPIFHFTDIGIAIRGSFDLSFPVFFKNKESIGEFSNIAKKNKLFFRNIKLI